MREVGYYNGKICPLDELMIPAGDRAIYFGDGVYDVASILRGKLFDIGTHIDRFFNCCAQLEMPMRMSKPEFLAIIEEVKSHLDPDIAYATVYWQATRGNSPRNHVYPSPDIAPSILMYIRPAAAPDYEKKAKLITLPDIRFKMCNIKTINLLPNVIASQRAAEAGCTEAVLHKDGRCTECAHSGLAILKNGKVFTAPLNEEILPSTTRKHLVELCRENSIPLEERFFTLDELYGADEILVLSTSKGFMPACEVDKKPAGGKDPELLSRLRSLFFDFMEKDLSK